MRFVRSLDLDLDRKVCLSLAAIIQPTGCRSEVLPLRSQRNADDIIDNTTPIPHRRTNVPAPKISSLLQRLRTEYYIPRYDFLLRPPRCPQLSAATSSSTSTARSCASCQRAASAPRHFSFVSARLLRPIRTLAWLRQIST